MTFKEPTQSMLDHITKIEVQNAELLGAVMDMLAYVPPLYHDYVKDGDIDITVPVDDLDRVVDLVRKAGR